LVIHDPAGRTETDFTEKGNKFKVTTMRVSKESAPIRRGVAMEHPVDVIQNILDGADDILDVFKVVRKIVCRMLLLYIRRLYNKRLQREILKTPHE